MYMFTEKLPTVLSCLRLIEAYSSGFLEKKAIIGLNQ